MKSKGAAGTGAKKWGGTLFARGQEENDGRSGDKTSDDGERTCTDFEIAIDLFGKYEISMIDFESRIAELERFPH